LSIEDNIKASKTVEARIESLPRPRQRATKLVLMAPSETADIGNVLRRP
jgi:hypothetical protein